MRIAFRQYLLLTLFCALPSSLLAQEDGSAWNFSLQDITVKGYRHRSPVKGQSNGVTLFDMGSMNVLPQFSGSADPMHYAQTLPGIQTNNEYRSGINIEGCDNQHNALSIEGVPVYNVNHLLGFFSAFNASHFHSMSIAKGLVSAGSPNRLGGQLDMLHHTDVPDSLNGTISLGLISSQGTVQMPLGPKTAATVSFRTSYINMLYSQWLKVDGQQMNYSFYDLNASLLHRLDDKNTFLLDCYNGNDHAGFSESYYLSDMKAQWGNTIGAAHWLFNNDLLSARTTAYVSSYHNRFSLDMQDFSFRLPSSIFDLGLKSSVTWQRWSTGIELIWHDIHPQSIEHEGDINITDGYNPPQHAQEASLYINYEHPLSPCLKASGGIRGSAFHAKGASFVAADPSLRLLYDRHTFQLSATYALRHQYLFQTGFSDVGLPTEFWLCANKDFKPQYAHEVSASGNCYLFNRRLRVSADVFYRKLYHQLGYKGSVLDYVNAVYDISQSLMHGKGENYGFSLMANKCAGALTGWLSYTYTHARRSFDVNGRRKYSPASHERPHELNAVATYTLGSHWSFGGTFVYASGTPFTAAKSLYLLNNNIVIDYGDYNAARLKPYMRIDLSANYKWGKNSQHGLNLSLYNVTSHRNELFYYVRTREEGTYVYRPVTFVFNMLPTVSYYYQF